MKIVYVSNYFNHHQKPLSDALFHLTDGEYTFISTAPMREERRKLGYVMPDTPYHLIAYSDNDAKAKAMEIINNADVVLTGSADYSYLKERIHSRRLLIKCGERPLRHGIEPFKYLPRRIKWHRQYPSDAPIYLLCASAYAAWDYARMGMFRNRAYRWAYFTETKRYRDIDLLIEKKKKNSLLWVARLIELKHPEHILEVVRRLKEDGYDLSLNIIGSGPMEGPLKRIAAENEITEEVTFCGAMSPVEVRRYMECAEIFAFTSNREEGWGAVINEAMNSGCAVVGSNAAGAVPFLIRNSQNGLTYQSGDVDMLYEKIRYLLNNTSERKRMGKEAYRTITELWNADVAAERLINLSRRILAGEKSPQLYENGPCSTAEILKE